MSNLFRRPDGTYFFVNNDGSQVDVKPLTKLSNNESTWTFVDDNNKLYTPSTQHNNGEIIQDNRNSGLRFWDGYLGELKYNLNNSIPIKGKHTLPIAGLMTLGAAGGTSLINSILTRGALNTAFDTGVSTVGGLTVDLGSRITTGKSFGKNIEELSKGYIPEAAGTMLNPGFLTTPHNVGKAATYVIGHTNPGKRLVETAMRTTSAINPIGQIWHGIKTMPKDRLKAVTKYIITGNPTEGLVYDSFGVDALNSTVPVRYQGLFGEPLLPQEGYGDVIDAFIWNKELDPRIAKRVEGDPLGIHELYVKDNYPTRHIRVYETEPKIGEIVDELAAKNITPKVYNNDGSFPISTGASYDAQGHKVLDYGTLGTRSQDIWKFNPGDYNTKYFDGNYNPLYKRFINWGLRTVDAAGNPIIVRTPIIKPNHKSLKDYLISNTSFKGGDFDLDKYKKVKLDFDKYKILLDTDFDVTKFKTYNNKYNIDDFGNLIIKKLENVR